MTYKHNEMSKIKKYWLSLNTVQPSPLEQNSPYKAGSKSECRLFETKHRRLISTCIWFIHGDKEREQHMVRYLRTRWSTAALHIKVQHKHPPLYYLPIWQHRVSGTDDRRVWHVMRWRSITLSPIISRSRQWTTGHTKHQHRMARKHVSGLQ
jgi:hypothetical protein